MANAGASIEAVLTLNNSGFTSGLEKSISSLENFATKVSKFSGNLSTLESTLNSLNRILGDSKTQLKSINDAVAGMKDFNSFATAINKTANALKILSDNTMNAEQGINILNNVFKAWGDTLNGTEVKIKGVVTSIEQINNPTKQADNTLKQMQTDLMNLQKGVEPMARVKEQSMAMRQEFERSRAELMQFAQYGVTAFNEIDARSNTLKSQIASMNAEFERSKAELLEFARYGLIAFNEASTGAEKLNAIEKQLNTSVNQTSASMQKQASSTRQASASTQQLTSSTNALSKALSSLKMIGTLVASMLVWNFASSLINATRETVNAKSEMEGYFKMLNFSQKDIDGFNQALDRTVQQFQRVNKYALGETISSIGVEFNLTTKEMEKAMKVTSMVTSEYLRAGRNANEASLAVKDVLQGQFQRLSRETGVKGEQLKEAGWSGDTNDVLSLMEALEKVAESRNWDVFAEKANSLNDIVLILQNRFGEWSADMVYAVQPAIVGVFNMLMGTFDKFSGIATGIWEWLNSDGIAQSIIQWTGLATAITGVVSALVVYRTGANLVQVAQMGLTRTIASTILGLQAETVAHVGVRNALASKLLMIDAETVKEIGVAKAIASKVLGVNAEAVAELGLGRSLWATNTAREVEKLRLMENVTVINELVLAKAKEEAGNISGATAILGKIAGVEAETLSQHGLMVALAERVGISPTLLAMYGAETEAELTTAQASVLLTASLTPLIAVVGALVVVLGSMAIAMYNSAESMKKFNELAKNGENILKEKRNIVKDYTKKQESLSKQLSETTKYSKEWYRIQSQLRDTNRDLVTANYDLENSLKAVSKATWSQERYEQLRTEQAIDMQGKLADAYINAGYSMTEAYEMANDSLREAQEGADQLYQALQRLALAQERRVQGNAYLLDLFGENGVDEETAQEQLRKYNDYQSMIEKGLEKGLTDESFFGRLDGWLTHYQGQLGVFWTDLESSFISGDAEAFFENFGKGFGHFVEGHLPQGGIVKMIGDALGLDSDLEWGEISWDNINKIGDYLGQALEGLGEIIGQHFKNISVLGWIDELFNLEDVDVVTPITNFLNTLATNIQECWSNITTYDYIGEFLNTWGLADFDFNQWVSTNFTIPLGTAFYNGIMSIPLVSDILQLFGLVNGDNSGASQKGSDIGGAFQTKVEDKIRSIPILGDILQMLGVIPQANPDARAKGQGVGQNIKDGEKSGQNGIADNVSQEFRDALNGIGKLGQLAYDTAKGWAQQLWNGVNSILQRASPGFFHDQFKAEFGTDIPNAIQSSSATAYSVAQEYGQSVKDGISSVNNDFSMGGVADEYQQDAQMISTYSQMMGMDTTTAFNDMSLAVNDTTTLMASNVSTSYSTMQQKQQSLLNNMKTSNTTAYNEMYQKSNQSLLQMRDSTTNITNQMINAWGHMKTQLVATADALRNESTNHFNQLSNTIGSFYRKIQNPSSWGAGTGGKTSYRTSRNPSVGRRVGSALHGAGSRGDKYGGSNTMSIASLKRKLCPNGDCGNLFDGYSASDIVDVPTFLAMVEGEHGFGWSGWNKTHYNHIKNKSDQWSMKSPIINLAGGIPTDAKFKVGEFNNGTPKISFSEFQSMAGSIFSAIPYKHYYDSSWKGSWLGALQSGACNCSDGADALIAFAGSCGFGGYKQWGTWDGEGHFWAVINGVPMDTTAWQKGYGWTSPKVSGYGIPTRTATPSSANGSENKEVHIHIDMSNSTNYGMNDIEEIIEEGVKKGLREQFSNPVTVVI